MEIIKEFNLSEKRRNQGKTFEKFTKAKWREWNETKASKSCSYFEEDVKEFIKRLKEEITPEMLCCVTQLGYDDCPCNFGKKKVDKIIDKLAGEKLK